MPIDVVQYGEKDDEQFLVEVDLSLLVDGVDVDGYILLDDCRWVGDGTRPVYFGSSEKWSDR